MASSQSPTRTPTPTTTPPAPLPKVLLLGTIDFAHAEWAALAPLATTVQPASRTRAGFLAECADPASALAGAVVAYRTVASAAQTGPFDAALVAALPPALRAIAHCGAGSDQIDVAACSARGIRVAHVRGAADEPTADAAVWLALGALRNFGAGVEAVRRGGWRGGEDGAAVEGRGAPVALGREPRGLVLGVLGLGGIGRCFARKMAGAFGMRVVYHNRSRLAPDAEAEAGGAEYVGFERLLAESDVLSLHLPLNAETHHTLSHAQFAAMKPGALLINTSRGGVVDEAALAAALARGTLGGAGLDVYEHEPAVPAALRADPRVLLVPHMGTFTAATTRRMEACAIANVRCVLEGDGLLSVVPEQWGA